MNTLYVLTSLRQIRDFNLKFQDSLIPKAYTIDEFERCATFVKNRVQADSTKLLLIMREACKMSERAQKKLNIPTEFFAFLRNNDYLFSFYKELASQKKTISDIKFSDIYASYEEHLQILEEVAKNYKEILAKNSLYDEITFCDIYEMNGDFIKSYDEIICEVSGILSEVDWEILQKCSKLTTLKIRFQTSKYNQKLILRIANICAKEPSEFELYHKFELNLSTLEIVNLGKTKQNKLVLTRAFEHESLQAAFVFEKISTFMKDGILPQNIAVILPDESFAQTLRAFDDKNMLSYAMGLPFEYSQFYAVLSALNEAVKENLALNLSENFLKERDDIGEIETFLNFSNINEVLFEKFKNLYPLSVKFEIFNEIIFEISSLYPNKDVDKILSEEMFFISNLTKDEALKFAELVEILLMRLKAKSIDEAHGGEVRAIGILESRGLNFDGVIIVDFNDDIVPKRSVNEMFLSSKVREKAGLISYYERENLQRFYYESLISGAKKVAISYVVNESKIASRFLSEFDCVYDTSFANDDYLGLFPLGRIAKFEPIKLQVGHDFFADELSFSRLDTFLSCARKYYYKYILHLNEGKNLELKSHSKYGKIIHDALFKYYLEFKEFKLQEFMKFISDKGLNPLEYKITEQKFKIFEQNEKERALQGWEISELECEKRAVYEGVKIYGRIDRIDKKDVLGKSEFCVIDYKTGAVPKDTLQLAFYQALLGENSQAYFYDLKEKMSLDPSKTAEIPQLKEALDKAKEYFVKEASFEQNIGSSCTYCAYKTFCLGQTS
ncbi:RecB family exonuclease [Campylobacter californiensis]|uniref:RecB family exonuclease n=1 Tax=Campylobacter californiensis TaxID=1032243 RepID=UPI00147385CB|nr:PD-(D/E)XK nuclease family protein [Campylobacter sp. RM12916]MBE3609543.1 PD-(D/E)XK nuclease family protein [Campylobacter sp. RM12916]